MKLKVLLPDRTLVDEEDVRKVSLEAEDGAITLLARHQDLATALVPGILSFESAGGGETFLALAEGTLVKCGEEVLVSARRGILGPELGNLRERVEAEFRQLDERETSARTALAKIEATFVHRFIELEHGPQ
jgi:F-type H+-transporting ATPase subunit epsilon